jgi:DNA-directed RNA polymerase I, II, and III subunit RPABC1
MTSSANKVHGHSYLVFEKYTSAKYSPHTYIEQVIQGMSAKYHLESFQEAELLVNITKHVLVPIHIVLSTEEKLALLKR